MPPRLNSTQIPGDSYFPEAYAEIVVGAWSFWVTTKPISSTAPKFIMESSPEGVNVADRSTIVED